MIRSSFKYFINNNNKLIKISAKTKTTRTETKEVNLSSFYTNANSDKVTKKLVFLHGLFGSSNNWRYLSYADSIRNRRNSILIDLRNHGESDHHASMTYNEMSDDVIRHLDKLKVDKFTLVGHSMGAKTAMHIATKIKDRVDGLIIVDAAPKDHRDNINIYGNTQNIVNAVCEYDLREKTRRQAIEKFKEMFGGAVANLLGTNLSYVDSDTEKIEWRVNVQAIKNNYFEIIGYENDGIYEGKVIVLQGEKSHRWDVGLFNKNFPKIQPDDIKIIDKAGKIFSYDINIILLGHWVHSDNPEQTLYVIGKFLEQIDS